MSFYYYNEQMTAIINFKLTEFVLFNLYEMNYHLAKFLASSKSYILAENCVSKSNLENSPRQRDVTLKGTNTSK